MSVKLWKNLRLESSFHTSGHHRFKLSQVKKFSRKNPTYNNNNNKKQQKNYHRK